MSDISLTRHISSDEPRVLVVDGSRVVRQLIERVLKAELPNAVVIGCGSGADALAQLPGGVIDLVTTSLRLPDMDGMQLARAIRESNSQAYIPIVVVSGDVQERLLARSLDGSVTDYFDKSLGFDALAAFIRGYVHQVERVDGSVLYVEDSRVVALATRRMMEKCGFTVSHVVSVEPRSNCWKRRARKAARRATTSCSPTSASRAICRAATCSIVCAIISVTRKASCPCSS
jgi:CheY-like chemotaxis protein